jgi:uncharacterized membrane protein
MILTLTILTTLCIGLLIGTEFSVSVFINPILRRLDVPGQAHAIRLFAQRLGAAMPFWYAAGLLLLLSEAIIYRHASGDVLLIAAGTIWAAVIIHTIVVLVPINNRLARLNPDTIPQEAQREHRKWDSLHRFRVAALVAAMVCHLVAVSI